MNIKSTNRKKSQIAIENALFELIQTKPINNISISEICKKADVNRSTKKLIEIL